MCMTRKMQICIEITIHMCGFDTGCMWEELPVRSNLVKAFSGLMWWDLTWYVGLLQIFLHFGYKSFLIWFIRIYDLLWHDLWISFKITFIAFIFRCLCSMTKIKLITKCIFKCWFVEKEFNLIFFELYFSYRKIKENSIKGSTFTEYKLTLHFFFLFQIFPRYRWDIS